MLVRKFASSIKDVNLVLLQVCFMLPLMIYSDI